MLKRAYRGTYHKMSVKHLNRYINEFASSHNLRHIETIEQIKTVFSSTVGKQPKHETLVIE